MRNGYQVHVDSKRNEVSDNVVISRLLDDRLLHAIKSAYIISLSLNIVLVAKQVVVYNKYSDLCNLLLERSCV